MLSSFIVLAKRDVLTKPPRVASSLSYLNDIHGNGVLLSQRIVCVIGGSGYQKRRNSHQVRGYDIIGIESKELSGRYQLPLSLFRLNATS